MNCIHRRPHIRTYSKPVIGMLALALLAGCSAAPSVPEAIATPIAAAPAPTALPPTAIPPTPTAPPPTAIPPTPTTPEAPTDSTSAQPVATPASAGYLVYQRPDGSLWRADGNKQAPVSLAAPTDPAALLPWAAAPDGKTIAVVLGTGLWGAAGQEPPTLALWLVGADGSNLRKIQDLLPQRGVDLTPGGDDAFNLLPALTFYQQLTWSPDGQLITFVSAHQDQVDLYSAALDGTIVRLTDTPRLEQGPRWSPDGALIAYRTASGFGTGAGWGDVALESTARGGGPPTLVMDDRTLAGGSAVVAVPDLLWISPSTIIAGLADSVVGNAELRALDTGAHTSTVIFDAPYSALAWNDTTRQLAIAGTSEAIVQANMDARKLAVGLFTWSPDAGPPIQIEQAPVEALAWTPQGDALAYSAGGDQRELRLWAIGAEGDIKPLANQPAKQLRWSLDGQLLATESAIYSRTGQLLVDRFNDQPATLIGWSPQGLFYATATDGRNHELWLWDDTLPQQIDTKLATTQSAGVVLTQP